MKITIETIKPKKDMLLVEPFMQATQTSAGLEISDSDGYATPVMGTVIKVGESVEKYPEGAQVMFRRYAIDGVKVLTEEGEKKFYLLEENEVIATIEE